MDATGYPADSAGGPPRFSDDRFVGLPPEATLLSCRPARSIVGGRETIRLTMPPGAKRVGLMAVMAAHLCTSTAYASCPFITTSEMRRISSAIYRGTPTKIENLYFSQIVTFRVDRVWQGAVRHEVTAYQRFTANQVPFVVGSSYLLFAVPRDLSRAPFDGRDEEFVSDDTRLRREEDKRRLEQVELEVEGCVSGPADAGSSQIRISELGPGHPPE